MTTAELIATYTYTGDIITLLIGLSLFTVISTSLFYSVDRHFTYYKHALGLVILGAAANIAFAMVVVKMPEQIFLLYLLRDIYHFCLLAALLIFILYMRSVLNLPEKKDRIITTCSYAVFAVGFLADVLGPVTGFGFYYRDGKWVDSTYAKPFTMVYIYALLVLGYMLFFSENRMVRQLRRVLILTALLSVAILITENMQDSNSYTSITFILPLLVVFAMVHSKPFDLVTGAVGLDALRSYIEHISKRNEKTTYVVLELKMDLMQQIPLEIGTAIHSIWHKVFSNTTLFNIENGLYVLAIHTDNRDAVRAGIKGIIERDFGPYYDKYHIPFKMLTILDGDFIPSADALCSAIDYFLGKMDYNTAHTTNEKEMADLKKSYAIQNQLADIKNKGDLNDERVLAYCQPVKNIATGRFDTAEILMRMKLPDIGFVFPDEFIPLAEKHGYIHSLSMIILNKACAGVSQLMKEGYEFERVSVNFAIKELHDSAFCNEVLDIIEKNGIPYDKIAIELTESQNDSDFQMVFEKIKTLRQHGIRFYLDDFGTGYSNFERIIRMKLDIIKFDRSMLLYGESDHAVSYTLKHFSEAFHELGFKVLFEGLENEQQEELCKECKADYMQGYKYSKPIPMMEYRDFLTKEEE